MGWVIAITLALLLLVAMLLVGRLPRTAWEITAAALLLGLAGYAWQGNPSLPGSPRVAEKAAVPFDEAKAEQRRGLADRYGPAAQWMVLSDGYGRRGQTKEAANVLLSGLKVTPGDANLWLGLGNALVAHGGGMLSPGADYAYSARSASSSAISAPARSTRSARPSHGHHHLTLDETNIMGVISLMFWSMMAVVTLKYVTVIMRADNKGEGGSLALLALISADRRAEALDAGIVLLGVFATALFYGDSMITPAVSVLSAVEGLAVAAPGAAGWWCRSRWSSW
jgi:cytochrome c-type biogenesis protein CcmH